MMDLHIFIVLLLTLFTGGHSLKCYQCTSGGSCVNREMICPTGATVCASGAVIHYIGDSNPNRQFKGCEKPQHCINTSVNVGGFRFTSSGQCCDTDLCNNGDVPDLPSYSPNGKKCYNCDGKSCLNTLSCLGTEDYCITAKATSENLPATVKGCASKSFCDFALKEDTGLTNITCCAGNLCNSGNSITERFCNIST